MAGLYVALSPLSPQGSVQESRLGKEARYLGSQQRASLRPFSFYYGLHPQVYASRTCSASSIADRWPVTEDKQTPVYDLVVSSKPKQRDAMNANPDF